MRIKSLTGSKPHPDYKGWANFLKRHCELRDEYKGVKYYGATNCNYIVFPCGTLIENFGYHGRVMMQDVRKTGVNRYLRNLKKGYSAYQKTLKRLDGAIARFTEVVSDYLEKRRKARQHDRVDG